MRVLVTGSAGFVGKRLLSLLQDSSFEVVGLDYVMPHSSPKNHVLYRLGSFEYEPNHLSGLIGEVDAIINLAAESHVDRSISGPKQFIDNNVMGCLEILEACRYIKPKMFLHFSTDEVGACLDVGQMMEKSPFHTGSVYSASKAAQEHLCQAYAKTHGLNLLITRCVNIFGEGQADEKFIPMICNKVISGEPITIYGNGYQERQWVYVDHVCEMVRDIVSSTFVPPGAIFHITGTKEIPNLVMAHLVSSLLGCGSPKISHIEDRLGHDVRYSLGSEVAEHYGFSQYASKNSFISDLKKTVLSYSKDRLIDNCVDTEILGI
jgi:dTDP-glucose 4,6-dehydratase